MLQFLISQFLSPPEEGNRVSILGICPFRITDKTLNNSISLIDVLLNDIRLLGEIDPSESINPSCSPCKYFSFSMKNCSGNALLLLFPNIKRKSAKGL